MNKKGFLLLDSLISVFVTSVICILCYSVFSIILNYQQGYENYQINMNDDMVGIFTSISQCQGCLLNESD